MRWETTTKGRTTAAKGGAIRQQARPLPVRPRPVRLTPLGVAGGRGWVGGSAGKKPLPPFPLGGDDGRGVRGVVVGEDVAEPH